MSSIAQLLKSPRMKERVRRSSVLSWLHQSYQSFKSKGHSQAIWQDLEKTKIEARFIREAHYPATGKRVLIGSYSDWIYQIKIESVFASQLRHQGFEPIIFADRLCAWAHRYFKAFGISHFAYPEDFGLDESTRHACDREGERLLKGDLNFSAAKAWIYRGVKIGPQVLSGISRRNHLGAPDLRDPAIFSELVSQLKLTLYRVHQVDALLEKTKPEMVILNEANGPLFGTLTDLAIQKGMNVLMYVQPSRDDGIIWKRLNPETRKLHPNSVSPENMQKFVKEPWTELREDELEEELSNRYSGIWALQGRNQSTETRTKTKAEIFKELGLDALKPVACIFSHILWDANLFYGEDLFEDYGDWFVQTVQAACANPSVQWLLKLHPANTWKRSRDSVEGELAEMTLLREKVGTLPAHVKLILPDTHISTFSLFEAIDAGITVRGTVGIELPCFGKPVYTAGTGRYSDLGFTRDFKTKEDYLTTLKSLNAIPAMTADETRKAKVHAYVLFHRRPWLIKSFKPEFKWQKAGKDPLDHNLSLKVKSWNEAEELGDLHSWSNWAVDRSQVDYLSE